MAIDDTSYVDGLVDGYASGRDEERARCAEAVKPVLEWLRSQRHQRVISDYLTLSDMIRALESVGKPAPKAHQGDPCVHCGVGHDDVDVGDCPGAASEVKP